MDIEKIDWNTARKLLIESTVDQTLINVIDQCVNNSSYFYVAQYRYGEKIIDKGRLLLSDTLPNSVKVDLMYNAESHPLSVVLAGCSELFLDNNHNIIPYALFTQGQIVSSWLALDDFDNSYHPRFIWDMIAGVRSAFLINSINRERNHNNLCKQLNLALSKPNNLREHFNLFKDITDKYCDDWCFKTLIFPKPIIDHLKTQWELFRLHLIERAWSSSSYLRNSVLWNSIYSVLASQLNLRVSAYDLSCIKHIIGVATGNTLGFEPCVDERYMPIAVIQKSYYEHYGLAQFNQVPAIMIPAYKKQAIPIYYSFAHPNNIEIPIKVDSYNSDRKYANYLESIFNKITSNLNRIAASNYSPIIKALNSVKFEFHGSPNCLAKYYHPDRTIIQKVSIQKHNKFLRTYIKII